MKKSYDPHNPEDVKKSQEEINRNLKQQNEDIQWVLSTVQGRRFVWRMLSICRVFRISFTGNSETFFNEGARNVGLKLYDAVLSADEQAYLKMRNEAKGEQNDN